jgi:hypothetical protein
LSRSPENHGAQHADARRRDKAEQQYGLESAFLNHYANRNRSRHVPQREGARCDSQEPCIEIRIRQKQVEQKEVEAESKIKEEGRGEEDPEATTQPFLRQQ